MRLSSSYPISKSASKTKGRKKSTFLTFAFIKTITEENKNNNNTALSFSTITYIGFQRTGDVLRADQ